MPCLVSNPSVYTAITPCPVLSVSLTMNTVALPLLMLHLWSQFSVHGYRHCLLLRNLLIIRCLCFVCFYLNLAFIYIIGFIVLIFVICVFVHCLLYRFLLCMYCVCNDFCAALACNSLLSVVRHFNIIIVVTVLTLIAFFSR
jgi:hypothetical protein